MGIHYTYPYFRSKEDSVCPQPWGILPSQRKILLDFPLFPATINLVENTVWSAGACSRFSVLGPRGLVSVLSLLHLRLACCPNRLALTHLESTLAKMLEKRASNSF